MIAQFAPMLNITECKVDSSERKVCYVSHYSWTETTHERVRRPLNEKNIENTSAHNIRNNISTQ